MMGVPSSFFVEFKSFCCVYPFLTNVFIFGKTMGFFIRWITGWNTANEHHFNLKDLHYLTDRIVNKSFWNPLYDEPFANVSHKFDLIQIINYNIHTCFSITFVNVHLARQIEWSCNTFSNFDMTSGNSEIYRVHLTVKQCFYAIAASRSGVVVVAEIKY